MFHSLSILLLLACTVAIGAAAQQDPQQHIEDNSFLLEEAYNQEPGIIQHISSFMYQSSGDWAYTFTQEWPLPRFPKHQLSLTLPVLNSSDFEVAGVGDIALNYRYQVVRTNSVAFAPRVSLLTPTGSSRFGRGFGGTGVQFNLPLSVNVGRHFVTHWNAGTTLVPNARNEFGNRAFSTGYNFGQSTIWLAHSRFNVMLESIWTGIDSVIASDRTVREHDLFISPGIRWAYNIGENLQIVPGMAVPVGVGSSAGDRGIILYLSFEHKLWNDRAD